MLLTYAGPTTSTRSASRMSRQKWYHPPFGLCSWAVRPLIPYPVDILLTEPVPNDLCRGAFDTWLHPFLADKAVIFGLRVWIFTYSVHHRLIHYHCTMLKAIVVIRLSRLPKGSNIVGQLTPRSPDKCALNVQISEAQEVNRLRTPRPAYPLSDLKYQNSS